MEPQSARDSTRLRRLALAWVPGVIAGAADADPTTVVTIAVVGASTVYGLSWLILLLFPLLAVVQVTASRVGLVTGRDLQSVTVNAYRRPVQLALLASILVVNVLTVAADLEGGAAAIGLLTGRGWQWFVVPVAAIVTALVVFGAFRQVQRFLLAALACLFAYVVSAFFVDVDWSRVVVATVHPSFHLNSTWIGGGLAILGTTLTGYVYVWLTIEESEDASPETSPRARATGAWGGILVSVILFWFILVATGATLGVQHRKLLTAQDAAQALRPLAGSLATDLFGVGLLASAMVALPVIAATSAYVVGAQLRWRVGLSLSVHEARHFYTVLVAGIFAGVLIAVSGLSPVHLLYVASVAGGLATPVGLVVLVSLAGRASVMGGRRITGWLRVAGWVVSGVLTALSCLYVVRAIS
jgi:Mn2+/Fe2+ NRAMP family transporter